MEDSFLTPIKYTKYHNDAMTTIRPSDFGLNELDLHDIDDSLESSMEPQQQQQKQQQHDNEFIHTITSIQSPIVGLAIKRTLKMSAKDLNLINNWKCQGNAGRSHSAPLALLEHDVEENDDYSNEADDDDDEQQFEIESDFDFYNENLIKQITKSQKDRESNIMGMDLIDLTDSVESLDEQTEIRNAKNVVTVIGNAEQNVNIIRADIITNSKLFKQPSKNYEIRYLTKDNLNDYNNSNLIIKSECFEATARKTTASTLTATTVTATTTAATSTSKSILTSIVATPNLLNGTKKMVHGAANDNNNNTNNNNNNSNGNIFVVVPPSITSALISNINSHNRNSNTKTTNSHSNTIVTSSLLPSLKSTVCDDACAHCTITQENFKLYSSIDNDNKVQDIVVSSSENNILINLYREKNNNTIKNNIKNQRNVDALLDNNIGCLDIVYEDTDTNCESFENNQNPFHTQTGHVKQLDTNTTRISSEKNSNQLITPSGHNVEENETENKDIQIVSGKNYTEIITTLNSRIPNSISNKFGSSVGHCDCNKNSNSGKDNNPLDKDKESGNKLDLNLDITLNAHFSVELLNKFDAKLVSECDENSVSGKVNADDHNNNETTASSSCSSSSSGSGKDVENVDKDNCGKVKNKLDEYCATVSDGKQKENPSLSKKDSESSSSCVSASEVDERSDLEFLTRKTSQYLKPPKLILETTPPPHQPNPPVSGITTLSGVLFDKHFLQPSQPQFFPSSIHKTSSEPNLSIEKSFEASNRLKRLEERFKGFAYTKKLLKDSNFNFLNDEHIPLADVLKEGSAQLGKNIDDVNPIPVSSSVTRTRTIATSTTPGDRTTPPSAKSSLKTKEISGINETELSQKVIKPVQTNEQYLKYSVFCDKVNNNLHEHLITPPLSSADSDEICELLSSTTNLSRVEVEVETNFNKIKHKAGEKDVRTFLDETDDEEDNLGIDDEDENDNLKNILSGDVYTNCEFNVRHLNEYAPGFCQVYECYDELEDDNDDNDENEIDNGVIRRDECKLKKLIVPNNHNRIEEDYDANDEYGNDFIVVNEITNDQNANHCNCLIEAVPLYRPNKTKSTSTISEHNLTLAMRETNGTLRGLLKKPNRPPPQRKNRVVFDETRNQFFEADYIILIREDCPYDEEDEEPCTCGEHELVRICCDEGCNCGYTDDGRTPPVSNYNC